MLLGHGEFQWFKLVRRNGAKIAPRIAKSNDVIRQRKHDSALPVEVRAFAREGRRE